MKPELPAILGGTPAFDSLVPLVRPALPPAATMQGVVEEMMTTGSLTKGKRLHEFEQALAEHLQVRHAVAVSSCTTGLMLAYRGLGLEGEAVVPSFTFMATVSALVWAGVRPVFADVDFHTATLDVDSVEAAITSRTSAIVAVHTFGNPAELELLQDIADRRGVKLIYDAAHGFGSTYRGVPVGAQGDAQVFSLSPTKLVVAGEGGVVATNDDRLAEQIRLGREYGNDGAYDSAFAGINARLPEFNAALGLRSLRMLESSVVARNRLADRYGAALADVPGISLQLVRSGNRCSFKDFSITVDSKRFGLDRDQLAAALLAERIDTRKYYYPAVHRQTAYRRWAPDDRLLPNSIKLADRSLSLPMGAHITDDDVLGICDAIARLHRHAAAVRETSPDGLLLAASEPQSSTAAVAR
jgi:dTDP-4-amino-4,6-dideoxygalactose transaminase